jgi:glucose-6-phosphate 1-epimerase
MSQHADKNFGYNIVAGSNGYPKVVLTAPDSARAEIYLHGAHVTSWIPAGEKEWLFLSQKSEFSPNSAIRGGVPVIFPQFSGEGPLPKHGFARRMEWKLLSTEAHRDEVTAVFQLQDTSTSRQIWPYGFTLDYTVRAGGQKLEMSLSVTNTGKEPFSFTGALHTYLRVAEIEDIAIAGLEGLPYLDTVGGRKKRIQQEESLSFNIEVDRIYLNAPKELTLQDKGRKLSIEERGFTDVVTWNPWSELGASLADLELDGYRHMVCIEAAVIGRPVALNPSESWSGAQILHA